MRTRRPGGSDPAIEVRGLRCRFGALTALDGVDLRVERGEVIALVGHNGAGKSTLLRVLAGRVVPGEGTAAIHGLDVVAQRVAAATLTGAVLGPSSAWHGALSGRDNLHYYGGLAGLGARDARRRAATELAAVGLEHVADRPVDGYSTGMRAGLAVARACLAGPSTLLLDEPSAGLDHAASERLRARIAAAREHAAVVLATHDVEEVAAVADRVVVLAGGRVAARILDPTDTPGLRRALA